MNYNVTILLLSLLSGAPGLTQLSNLMISVLTQVTDYHAARMRKSGGGVGLLLFVQVVGFNHAITILPFATCAMDEEIDYTQTWGPTPTWLGVT